MGLAWLVGLLLLGTSASQATTSFMPIGGHLISAMEPTHPSATPLEATHLSPNQLRAYHATLALRIDSIQGPGRIRLRSVGSAVAIAHEPHRQRLWLATSAHVVPCELGCRITVDFPTGRGSADSRRARVRWVDRLQDLALLSVKVPVGGLFEVIHRPHSTEAPPAPRVISLGFPAWHDDPDQRTRTRPLRLAAGRLIDHRSTLHLPFRSVGASEVEGHLHFSDVYVHTATIAPGSSGGPLIGDDGSILGIHAGSLRGSSDAECYRVSPGGPCAYLAVGLRSVWQELDRRGLGGRTPTPPSRQHPKNSGQEELPLAWIQQTMAVIGSCF